MNYDDMRQLSHSVISELKAKLDAEENELMILQIGDALWQCVRAQGMINALEALDSGKSFGSLTDSIIEMILGPELMIGSDSVEGTEELAGELLALINRAQENEIRAANRHARQM